MDFPIEDVVKNVRHFLEIVKKSTSSTEDSSASKNVTKGNTRSGEPAAYGSPRTETFNRFKYFCESRTQLYTGPRYTTYGHLREPSYFAISQKLTTLIRTW